MNKNTKLIFKNIAYLLIIFFLFKFFIFSYFKSIYYTILGLFKKSNSDDSDSNFGNDSDSDTDSDSDSDTDSVSDDKSTYWDMRDVEGFLFFFIFGTLLNLFVALFPLLFSFIIYKKITLLGFFIGFIIQWIFLLNTNPYPLSQNNKLAIMELVPIKYRPEVQFPLNEINRTHFNYPIIIKPTVCSGQGKDVKIVKNKKELQDFFKKTKDTKNYMVQNYLYDYTSSFFSIFNKNYILVKRDNEIIGALTIKNIKDTSPLRIIVQPFRHILTNNTIENKTNNVTVPLYLYYGMNSIQNESINFAIISSIKNNINNVTEFLLDRSININVGDIILVGINQTGITPINNYNNLYGIFKNILSGSLL